MMHLRIVSPTDRTDEVSKVLECTRSVLNIIHLPAAAKRPDGAPPPRPPAGRQPAAAAR